MCVCVLACPLPGTMLKKMWMPLQQNPAQAWTHPDLIFIRYILCSNVYYMNMIVCDLICNFANCALTMRALSGGKVRVVKKVVKVKKARPMTVELAEEKKGSSLLDSDPPPDVATGPIPESQEPEITKEPVEPGVTPRQRPPTTDVDDGFRTPPVRRSGTEETLILGQEPAWSPPPASHYDGGSSQWREEAEEQWSEWDWPPRDWRPNTWQKAWWDKHSDYYRYNHYDWNRESNREPPGKISPPKTVKTSPSDHDSIPSVEAVASVLRAHTGDLDLGNEKKDLQPDFDNAMHGKENENAVKPTAEAKLDNAGGEIKQLPLEANAGGAGAESLLKQFMAKAKKNQTPANSKVETSPPKEPNGNGGEAQNSGDQKSEEEKAAIEKARLAAHARYMRYYRSIRSPKLSARCIW